MQAGTNIIFNSNTPYLDSNTILADLLSPNATLANPSSAYRSFIVGPGVVSLAADSTHTLPLIVINAGPTTDSYTLVATDTASYPFSLSTNSISNLSGLSQQRLNLSITLPTTLPTNPVDQITVDSESNTAPTASTLVTIFSATGSKTAVVYLPLILK